MGLPYRKATDEIQKILEPLRKPKLFPNPPAGEMSSLFSGKDKRNRDNRKLPNFMYGATFPKDAIGAGGPSYGGALEWLAKHQDYFNQALRLIQRYPNLVQEKCLDHFWDFVEPLVYNNQLLFKYDEFLKSQFGFKETFELGTHFDQPLPTAAQFFKAESASRKADYHYPVRRVFFCYDRTCQLQQKIKHFIVDALEPFASVRTNPTKEQATFVRSLDICRSICGSVFLMLINDTMLRDPVCLHLLSIAIAYKTPVVFIRESGYRLPANLQDLSIKYVKTPTQVPFEPKADKITENRAKVLRVTIKQEIDETDMSSKQIKDAQKAAHDEVCGSLLSAIQEAYANSLVFSPKMFERSINAIYEKVAAHIGIQFPGNVPKFEGEIDSMDLSQPVSAGGMFPHTKRMYRVGSARVTRNYQEPINVNNSALTERTEAQHPQNRDVLNSRCRPETAPAVARSSYIPFQYNKQRAQRPTTSFKRSQHASSTEDCLRSVTGRQSPHNSTDSGGSW